MLCALTSNEAVQLEAAVKKAGLTRQHFIDLCMECLVDFVEERGFSFPSTTYLKLRCGVRITGTVSDEVYLLLKKQADTTKFPIVYLARLYLLTGIEVCGKYQGPPGPIGREDFKGLLRSVPEELKVPSRWDDFRQGLRLIWRALRRTR